MYAALVTPTLQWAPVGTFLPHTSLFLLSLRSFQNFSHRNRKWPGANFWSSKEDVGPSPATARRWGKGKGRPHPGNESAAVLENKNTGRFQIQEAEVFYGGTGIKGKTQSCPPLPHSKPFPWTIDGFGETRSPITRRTVTPQEVISATKSDSRASGGEAGVRLMPGNFSNNLNWLTME